MQEKRQQISYEDVQDFKLHRNNKFKHKFEVSEEFNLLQGPYNSPNLLYVSKRYGYVCIAAGRDPEKKVSLIYVFYNEGLERKESLRLKGEEVSE